MTTHLKDLAEIQAGYPFRGSVPAAQEGAVRVVQMRDISADGVAWMNLSRTNAVVSKSASWLRDGDVLFAARGARNYAVCLCGVPDAVVCSQYFFVLRCKTQRIRPGYLAWYINRLPSQRYLANLAEGTDQLSIRRGILEELPIAVPSPQAQSQIIALGAAARQQRQCLDALIRNTDQQQDALAQALLHSPENPDT